MLAVADFAQGCTALDVDATDLAGTQTNLCVDAFTGQQLCGTTGGTSDLTALARLHLDVVDRGTHRDVADGQGVAGANRGLGTGHQFSAGRNATRCQDVATLAVCVQQQS